MATKLLCSVFTAHMCTVHLYSGGYDMAEGLDDKETAIAYGIYNDTVNENGCGVVGY